MDITVVYDSSVTASNFSGGANEEAQFKAAITYVVDMFDNLFVNPVDLTINVGYGEVDGQSLPSNAAGANITPPYGLHGGLAQVLFNYAGITSLLENNSSHSVVQNLAYANLPSADPTDGGEFQLTDAEGAALGLPISQSIVSWIGFSKTSWNFSTSAAPGPSNPVADDYYFVGTFEHELTEAMGRVSLAGGPGGVSSPLDLFRYSAPGVVDPPAVPSGDDDTAYFSIDGGVDSLGIFNNDKKFNGNPYDLGDWTLIPENGGSNFYGGGTGPQGLDAFGAAFSGQILPFTYDDLDEMNALGWNLSVGDDVIPEGITYYVGSDEHPSPLVVQSGGYLEVSVGGDTHDDSLERGAFEDVYGLDGHAFIYAGDFQYGDQISQGQRVDSGGIALYATVFGGEQEIEAGGNASDTTLNGGLQKVFGSATATTIYYGGQQWVDGSDSGSTVEAGGVQDIYAKGADKSSTIDLDGQQDDFLGGTTDDETVSGAQYVYGVAYNTNVESGGQQIVEAGGVAYDTDVESGGSLSIHGSENSLQIDSGGSATVYDGGSLQDWNSALGDALEAVDGSLTFDMVGTYAYKGQLLGNGSLTLTTADDSFGGQLIVSDADDFTGSFTIDSGTLEFTSAAAMGSGTITFAAGANGTLRIDGAAMPANTIKGFAIGDTIDLAGVAYSASGSATLETGNVLQISEDGKNYDLQLDPSASYGGDTFMLATDAADGVDVSLAEVDSLPILIPPAILDADRTLDLIIDADADLVDSTNSSIFENGGVYRSIIVTSFLNVDNGGVTTVANLTNDHDISIDIGGFDGGEGGSVLDIGGVLANDSGVLRMGNDALARPTLITAGSLANTSGQISLIGSKTELAELDIDSAAGSGSPGVLTGDFDIEGDALLHFASGEITTINNGVLINGLNAFIATGADYDHNSALAGLSIINQNDGGLDLENGASVATTGPLTNQAFIYLDNSGDGGEDGDGGGLLTIGGELTNDGAGQIYIGNTNLTHPDEIATKGLENQGSIGLTGTSTSAMATLAVTGTFENASVLALSPHSAVNVAGDYQQTSTGHLTIDVSGSVFSGIAATGALSLAGGSTLQIRPPLAASLAAGTNLDIITFAPGQLTGMFGEVGGTQGTYSNLGNGTYGGVDYDDTLGKVIYEVVAAPATTSDVWTAGKTGDWTANDWSDDAPTFYSDVTLGAAAAVNLSTDATLDSLTLDSGASLTQQSGHSLSVGQGLTLAATATLTVDGEMTLGTPDSDSIQGSIVVNGMLDIRGIAWGGGYFEPDGSITIDSRGTLELEGIDYDNVAFSGSGGTLMLEDPGQFDGSITGLENGNSLQVAGDVTSASYDATSHALTLVDNGSTINLALNPSDNFSGAQFQLSVESGVTTITSSITWIGNFLGDNVWNLASNWSPAIIPGANDSALIGSEYSVTVDADTSVGELTLARNATLTFGADTGVTTFTVDDALSNSGDIEFGGAGELTLGGSDFNSGEIKTAPFVSDGTSGELWDDIAIEGDVNLDGNGDIVLTDPSDRMYGAAGPELASLTLNGVIEGVGQIFGMTLVLNPPSAGQYAGTIDADESLSDGGPASPFGGPDELSISEVGTITNGGLLEATHSGELVIQSNVDNEGEYGGIMSADDGTIVIAGMTVNGGDFQTSNGGEFGLDGSTLDDVTNSGSLSLVDSGAALTLMGAIDNDGTINLSGGDDQLVIDGDVSLGLSEGSQADLDDGVVSLQNADDQIVGDKQSALDLSGGVVGFGEINLPGGITIEAGGFILATGDKDTLTIGPGEAIDNAGTLGTFGKASSTLVIGDNVDNTGLGEISAFANDGGASVVISGVTITSGTISTGPNDSIEADNSTLDAVDVEATVNLGTEGASLTLEGAIGLNQDDVIATINFNAANQTLVVDGDVTVSGPGEIYLDGAGSRVASDGAFVIIDKVPSSLTLHSEIAGQGSIGDSLMTLTVGSQGQIVASGSGSLTIDTGANTIANSGLLKSFGGELVIGSSVNNAGGTIAAGSGDVEISGVTILGGALVSQSLGALILLENGSVLDGSSEGALTNESFLWIDQARTAVTLEGSIDNPALIYFDSQNQVVQLDGAVTLDGGGEVSLNDSTDEIVSNGQAATLTTSDQLVGVGEIGDSDTTLTVLAGGAIIADPAYCLTATSGDALTIAIGTSGIVNKGLLEARNGGALRISNDITNASGQIEAIGALSTVDLDGISVAGGALSTSSGGAITADDGLVLDGASEGVLTSGATVDLVTQGATLTLIGTIANSGAIVLDAQTQTVKLSGDVALTGAGSIAMGDFSDTLADNGSPTTLTVANEIAGVGSIGDGAMTLTISQGGSIVATTAEEVTTVSGNELTIAALAGALVNDGGLAAEDGATLVVNDSVAGSGEASIGDGRLELGGAFSQNIDFTNGDAGTLQIDDVTAFGGKIYGFTTGDTINLSTVAYDPNGSAALESGNVLQVVENGTTYEFHLDPNQAFAGDKIVLSKDTAAGIDLTVDAIPIVEQYIVPSGMTAIDPLVGDLGDLLVGSDAQATGGSVDNGGKLDVQLGGVAMGGAVDDGGVEDVESGGSAEGVLLNDPGLQIVEAGGKSSDTTVSGGEQDVYGSAYSTDIQSGGVQVVEAGGTAYEAEIDKGGQQHIEGGSDHGLYVDDGLATVDGAGALNAESVINTGSVLLNDAVLNGDFYFGGAGGTVEIAAGATIAGEIVLDGDDATLQIDGDVMPTAMISGFGLTAGTLGLDENAANDDVINLASIAYDPNGKIALSANNVLEVEEGGQTHQLNLDPTLSYAGFGFTLTADNAGTGTAITVGAANAWSHGAGGDWATSADWSNGTPTSGASLASDAFIGLANVAVTIAAGESEAVGSLGLDADDAVLNISGALTVDLTLSVAGGAALDIESGGVLTVGQASGSGLFETGGDELAGSVIGSGVTNKGSIESIGGTLTFAGAVTGVGALLVGPRSTLTIDGPVSGGQTISLTGSGGDLILADPTAFAASVSAAAFTAFQSSLDEVPKGVAISDTAADIESALAALTSDIGTRSDPAPSYGHILSITATNARVSVDVAEVSTYQPVLDLVVGGFAVADLAAHVVAGLSPLESVASEGHLDSIDLTDGGTPTLSLSAADVTDDAAALGKIVGPFDAAIVDTGANISADESAINSFIASGHVTSVSTSGAILGVASGLALTVIGGANTIDSGADAILDLTGAWDWVSGSKTTVDLTSAQASVFGGSDGIDFSGGSGDAVSLYDTVNGWDAVSGSGGTIYLTSAQASIFGGSDGIDFSGGSGDAASLYDTAKDWDAVSGSGGKIYLTSAQASIFGGSDGIDFSGGSGDAASLYDTAKEWDAVSGSGGTIYLASAQASIFGGSDGIDFSGGSGDAASLYDTVNGWDAVSGSGGTIYLTSAQASIFGGSDGIDFSGGSGDAASLYDTAKDWDAVSGSGGKIYLTSAQASIFGGSDGIDFSGGSGDAASLYDTVNGWDAVSGSGGTIYLTSAQASIFGGSDAIDFSGGSGDAASLYDTAKDWDAVSGSGGTIDLTSSQASVFGGGDAIDFAGGADNATSLYDTDNNWDSVTGSSGLVYLTSSQASIFGSLDTIDFTGGSGNAISVYSTNGLWDTVNGSNGTVYLTSAQASVNGGGDAIYLIGSGGIVSLGSAGGAGDAVSGSSAVVDLYDATAALTGSSDTVNFNESDTLTLDGASNTLTFQPGIAGVDVINGFASSDAIQLSQTDFASFAALMSSGDLGTLNGNAVITLGASDSITLQGVTAASLTSAQFRFV